MAIYTEFSHKKKCVFFRSHVSLPENTKNWLINLIQLDCFTWVFLIVDNSTLVFVLGKNWWRMQFWCRRWMLMLVSFFLRSPEEKNQECIPTIVWILKTQMWIPQNMKMSSSNMFLLFSTMVMSMMLGEIKTQAGENPDFSSRN